MSVVDVELRRVVHTTGKYLKHVVTNSQRSLDGGSQFSTKDILTGGWWFLKTKKKKSDTTACWYRFTVTSLSALANPAIKQTIGNVTRVYL